MYDISVSTMCIYCDYCVYHYKSTELVSLYTLDIGLKINIIIIIINNQVTHRIISGDINADFTRLGLEIEYYEFETIPGGRRYDMY